MDMGLQGRKQLQLQIFGDLQVALDFVKHRIEENGLATGGGLLIRVVDQRLN